MRQVDDRGDNHGQGGSFDPRIRNVEKLGHIAVRLFNIRYQVQGRCSVAVVILQTEKTFACHMRLSIKVTEGKKIGCENSIDLEVK